MSLVNYSVADGVATIVLDDGKVNALSPAMLGEVAAALDRAEDDDAIVLITGREQILSAGFDLKSLPEHPVEMLSAGARLAERLLSFPNRHRRCLQRERDRDGGLHAALLRCSDRRRRRLQDRPQ